jgi:hypothetical protein
MVQWKCIDSIVIAQWKYSDRIVIVRWEYSDTTLTLALEVYRSSRGC